MSTIKQTVRPAPDKYTSNGKTIVRSIKHEGMWLVNGNAIHTDDNTILKMYPPDEKTV